MKNINPHKFIVVFITKGNHDKIKKNNKLFVEIFFTNFTAIFLYGNGWLITFFPQYINIPNLKIFFGV